MKASKLQDQLSVKQITERVDLTNAQIKAMRATPVTLVNGLPNAVLILDSVVLRLNYAGTNAFTETADNMAVRFTNGSGAIVSSTIEATGFIDQTATTVTRATPLNDAIVASSSAVGKSLVLHNTGDGEYAGNAGADNTMTVWVTYRVLYV